MTKTSRVPKISVGMPVYNGAAYLGQAIESILNQTQGDLELIISDNASTDGTADICRRYAAEDRRIRFHRNDRNVGAARNYDLVFAKATAPYFRWSNADDVASTDLHAECLEVLTRRPDVVLAYGRTQLIDAEGRVTADYDDALDLQQADPLERYMALFDRIRLSNVLYGLMPTSVLRRTARMGPGTYTAADVNLIAEMTLHGPFIEIPKVLFYRRFHSAAFTWDKPDPKREAEFWNASQALACPRLRRHAALFRAVARSPLSLGERMKLYRFLLRRAYWKRQQFAHEIWDLARHYRGSSAA